MPTSALAAIAPTGKHPAVGSGRSGVGRSILVACSGHVVKWFDFFAYAFTALYFAPAFFPTDDTTPQRLNTAGIFAAGFFMRPVGGWPSDVWYVAAMSVVILLCSLELPRAHRATHQDHA